MNNYQEAIEYLMQRLPMFARIGSEAIKKGLTNIIALCEALGNPRTNFPAYILQVPMAKAAPAT